MHYLLKFFQYGCVVLDKQINVQNVNHKPYKD